jgi:hypothetical protein
MFRRKNYLGETRKKELMRRLEAAEGHIRDLEERFQEDKRTHLTEFHPGQDGNVKKAEE